jgi:ribosomal protein S27E
MRGNPMFKENKYTIEYYRIINQAKNRFQPTEYTEKHHIIPRCLGGENTKENIVVLTYKEHYVCHHLLTKMSDTPSLIHAFWSMSTKNRKKYYNAKMYADAKRLYVGRISGDNHWAKTQEYKKEYSGPWDSNRLNDFRKKVSGDNHWTHKIDMSKHSEDMRKGIDIQKRNQETSMRMKVNNPMKDPNIAEKFKHPKEKVTCPHCGKIGGKPVMMKYHFDECKHQ